MRFKTAHFVCAAAMVAVPAAASASVLFSDDFSTDSTANWTVNKSHPDNAGSDADFFFDYSTVGIPASRPGGNTHGLRLRANMGAMTPGGAADAVFSGLSVSPNDVSLPDGDFVVRFDAWMNYNGPLGTGGSNAAGGNGSTQAGSWGIMTSGTTAQWAGGAHDSLWFAATGDGGSSFDYRVYPNAALAGPASDYYAAGTDTSPDARNDIHPYYAFVGEETAPAAQVALFSQQEGTTRLGAAGMAWRAMEIIKSDDIVTWTMDGTLIATVDLNTVGGTFGGTNIFFGHFDINATASSDPNAPQLLFTLIDNIEVIPEPSALALVGLGAMSLMARRRRL